MGEKHDSYISLKNIMFDQIIEFIKLLINWNAEKVILPTFSLYGSDKIDFNIIIVAAVMPT